MGILRWISLLTALSIVVNVQATGLSDLPPCALDCMVQALPETNCSLSDLQCFCHRRANRRFYQNVTTCVIPACTVREALTAANISATTCGEPVREANQSVPVIAGTLCGIALVFVVIRIISRKGTLVERFDYDNILIIVTWLVAAAIFVFDVILYIHDMGKDIWTIAFHDLAWCFFLWYLGEIFYIASSGLVKIAILVFYLRVFGIASYTLRRIIFGLMTVIIAWTVAFFFSTVFQCWPVPYAWKQWDKTEQGTCTQTFTSLIVHSAINMVLDLVILLTPIPSLLKLHISTRRKVYVVIMFSLGLIVTVVSALRLHIMFTMRHTPNLTVDGAKALIWSSVEIYVAIICAGLPAAAKLLSNIQPKWMNSKRGTSEGEAAPSGKKPSDQKISPNFTMMSTPPRTKADRTFLELSDEENSSDIENSACKSTDSVIQLYHQPSE